MMTKRNLQGFHARLHRWYGAHGRRDLPWRNTQDAYAIYISEIMLQQTQVATVLSRFYGPFLKRFPTIEALAKASEQEVLGMWQGLGYYNRARNLHAAAKLCKTALPDTVDALAALPGIGRNTAHAVAAFAYRQPVAVMEANVKRVLSRIFAMKNPVEIVLWEKAALLLDRQQPFDYNQAMMDIGSLVCRKRAPLCAQCPAETICAGKTQPEAYPAPKAKKAVPVRKKHIVVLQNAKGQYYATPRVGKFLGGLYHFIEVDGNEAQIMFEENTYPLQQAAHIGHVEQQYSHFTLDAQVYLLRLPHVKKQWYSMAQLSKLPFSMAERKILQLIAG